MLHIFIVIFLIARFFVTVIGTPAPISSDSSDTARPPSAAVPGISSNINAEEEDSIPDWAEIAGILSEDIADTYSISFVTNEYKENRLVRQSVCIANDINPEETENLLVSFVSLSPLSLPLISS